MATVLAELSTSTERGPAPAADDQPAAVRPDVLENLQESMRVAVHGGLATWQVLAVAAILMSSLTAPALVAAHLALGVVAVLGRARGWPVGVLLSGAYAVQVAGLLMLPDATSAYAYVVVWGAILQTGTPMISMSGRAGALVALASVLVFPGLVGLGARALGWDVALLIGVLGTTVAVAAGLFMGWLRRRAAAVDRAILAAAQVQEETARQMAAEAASAEAARTIHDTVINSLVAVAGGVPPSRREAVRRQCAEDARRMRALMEGSEPPVLTLDAVIRGVGLEVRRTGLDDAAFARAVVDIAPDALGPVTSAVGELLRNADRHSGADHVLLEAVQEGRRVRVTVTDGGDGFDGRPGAGWGFAESVVARCEAVGASVDVASVPGAGTAVTIMLVDSPPTSTAPSSGPDPTRRALRLAVARGWAAVIGVSLIAQDLLLRAAGWPTRTDLVMLVIGLSLLASWACRRDRSLPAWCAAVLVVGTTVGYLMGVQQVIDAPSSVLGLSAISLTPLLTFLLMGESARAPVTGVVLLPVAAATTMGVLLVQDVPGAALALVLIVPQLGQFAGLVDLLDRLDVVLSRSAESVLLATAAREQLAADQGEAEVRGALRQGSLGDVLALVDDIAEGRVDPSDRSTARRCAAEEQHLRQTLLLDPRTSRREAWRTTALVRAHRRGVAVDLRSGSESLPAELSGRLGSLVLRLGDSVPAGSDLGVSTWFVGDRLWIVITGPPGSLRATDALAIAGSEAGDSVMTACTRVSVGDVLEVILPAPGSTRG